MALVGVLGCVGGPAAEDVGESPAHEFQAPGAGPFPAELERRLAAALEARGKGYVPRTHHLEADGSPRYTNRLILESSPYLLQHAHNPVNWYPWGDEAFEAARRLGRPVLLSIGYSTCHWCHVMEEESFEDLEIAEFMNANYIAIKVDREERPDVDSIYMSAVQMLTGRGGWPMTTWLTPDRTPFFGGTYFPARDGDRGTRRGFLTLLGQLRRFYDEQPEKAAERADEIAARIATAMTPAAGEKMPDATALDAAFASYAGSYDAEHGGLRRAPKFPSSLSIRLLLRHHRRTGDAQALEMATHSLTKMARGGMYDQVGGGFHRYSVDAQWLVPHFEKMLYDNGLLTVAYLEAFQATGNDELARVAREVLRYVSREMTAPGGAFYSATDADSPTPGGEREEGWFFTWTPAELTAVLGEEDARWISAYYGVTPGGNFEGRNILHVTESVEEQAARLEVERAPLVARLERIRARLYEERLHRPPPLRDDKILVSWNGLMISAFARGGFTLAEPEFTRRAADAADFVLREMRDDEGGLRRSYMDGRSRHNAYLDDYAFLIAGLLDLYEATFEARWLREAVELQEILDGQYLDADAGGYFMTSDDHETLLAREKPSRDGAEPSGNSIALMNLARLHELTTSDRYRVRADDLLRSLAPTIARSARSVSEALLALDFRSGAPKEVVIVTKGDKRNAEPFLRVLRENFVPGKVVIVARQGKDLNEQLSLVPLLQGKIPRKAKATAYVCERGVCKLPTSDAAVFRTQLKPDEGE
ncbi:MAG: thioredoxin domain-containing protein [bacterium]|nr:thioredoxin domain-containing protein [bacterium]